MANKRPPYKSSTRPTTLNLAPRPPSSRPPHRYGAGDERHDQQPRERPRQQAVVVARTFGGEG